MIPTRAKDYYENDKGKLRGQARDKYRNFLKKKKIKKENIGRIDIAICLKKKKKIKRISKKIIARLKTINMIMNRITFLIVIVILIFCCN